MELVINVPKVGTIDPKYIWEGPVVGVGSDGKSYLCGRFVHIGETDTEEWYAMRIEE